MVEVPEYEDVKTLEECEKLIAEHKDDVCRKLKYHQQIKGQKKESNAAFNEQLKELNEELETEIGIIDGLVDRKKRLMATEKGVFLVPPTKAAS